MATTKKQPAYKSGLDTNRQLTQPNNRKGSTSTNKSTTATNKPAFKNKKK